MRLKRKLIVFASLAVVACGGAKTPAESPSAASADGERSDPEGTTAAAESATESETSGIPTSCVDQHGTCVPPADFVSRLCQGSFPGVALAMFEGNSPWKRGYMRAEVDAVNASGGVTGEGKLVPGEEVVIVRVRVQDAGGMQVTGGGGWDVLRWDGTCATVSEGEMGLSQNGPMKAAPVTFRFLDEPTKEALRQNAAVDEAYKNRRQHCKGATMGEVTRECEQWDRKLMESIVTAVRAGIALPLPQKLP